jgi:hypothetical protein
LVAKPDDSKESKDAKKRQIRRQVSAIKTIMLVSGAYFVLYFPVVVFRLVLYGTVSPIDIEIRRYPALTLVVRCSVLAMSTTCVNPILYFNTRKDLRRSLLAFAPRVHLFGCWRGSRIGVINSVI